MSKHLSRSPEPRNLQLKKATTYWLPAISLIAGSLLMLAIGVLFLFPDSKVLFWRLAAGLVAGPLVLLGLAGLRDPIRAQSGKPGIFQHYNFVFRAGWLLVCGAMFLLIVAWFLAVVHLRLEVETPYRAALDAAFIVAATGALGLVAGTFIQIGRGRSRRRR